jgi:phosphatidylglycerol:prolipoprotein diacylglycerol transferase
VIGARLYYVLMTLGDYDSFLDVISIWNGGIAIYGAILGGLLTVFIVSKVKKASFFEVADYFAPAVMIGQICGRWGNFFNAEAYGALEKINFPIIGDIATPFFENDYIFRMVIENVKVGTIEVHPTFIYESLWNLLGFVIIHFLFNHKKFDGEIAALYFAWYGFGRFFIEGLRTDSLMSGQFRFSQLLGGVFAILGIVIIIVGRSIANKRTNKLDNYLRSFEDDSEM